MSKHCVPIISGEDAVRVFRTFGFAIDRVTGSHHIMKKEGHPNNLSVPVHKGRDLKKGTLRGLIDAANITVEQFNDAR